MNEPIVARYVRLGLQLGRHADGIVDAYFGPTELSAHVIRFFSEPDSRSYVLTYPAGRELCRAYVADDPARFRKLLTEQVRVRDLLDAASSESP